jgi:SAM-dependent methyltransferase
MGGESPSQSRPDYGIDAPDVVRNLFVIGAVGVILATLLTLAESHGHFIFIRFLLTPLWFIGISFVLQGFVMLWGSKVGKLRLRDKLIASIPWRGDETVLDVGCGRGLLLIAAARQLRSGKAIGVDIWQTQDQSGNSPDATLQNIRLENLSDRIELKDADARKLPFPDNTFDVVLSSWAIHNIYSTSGRETALGEMIRVLKPGGRLAVVDIRHVPQYAEFLSRHNLLDIRQSRPSYLFVIPTLTLTARKPQSSVPADALPHASAATPEIPPPRPQTMPAHDAPAAAAGSGETSPPPPIKSPAARLPESPG